MWESHWKVAEITIHSLKVYPKKQNKKYKTMQMTDWAGEYSVSNYNAQSYSFKKKNNINAKLINNKQQMRIRFKNNPRNKTLNKTYKYW